jgi:N-acetylmuramoyl-L-alanine amidase
VITVKTLPVDILNTVILIDPGHGGDETGSIGPSRVAEKEVNLAVSKYFADQLKTLGFKNTYLTRDKDVDISLEERACLAETRQADLIFSVHHNALPDGRDPLQYRGASSYYYHPFASALAKHMQQVMVRDFPAQNFGVLYDSLYLTRIYTGQAVLLELGFFTYPDEYDRLITDSFQQHAAQVLAQGVLAYLKQANTSS